MSTELPPWVSTSASSWTMAMPDPRKSFADSHPTKDYDQILKDLNNKFDYLQSKIMTLEQENEYLKDMMNEEFKKKE